MRMIQLLPEHQTPNHKPSKPTKEQLQNELNFHLSEKMLMKLREEEHISQEEFNQISELNSQKTAQRQNLFLTEKMYKKTSVYAKVESTTKQHSEVYRCTLILSRVY